MLDTVFGDATAEEVRALGYDPDDWSTWPSPWEFDRGSVTALRERRTVAQQEDIEPAEEVPLTPDELAAVYAEMHAEADQGEVSEDTAEAVTNDGWEDMTKRPNEWLQIVNRQDVPDRAVRVAVALASFGGTGNTKDVFPTIETLTTMMPKKRRAVAEGVADLRKADLIREQSRAYNGPVTYKLGANTK